MSQKDSNFASFVGMKVRLTEKGIGTLVSLPDTLGNGALLSLAKESNYRYLLKHLEFTVEKVDIGLGDSLPFLVYHCRLPHQRGEDEVFHFIESEIVLVK